ncbi:MAG: right-handed parallel beta-helix repeat-containing protein, partial [Planctomycetales bacterium]|nr:right-handed parallel beta-helix repeat-containing protein [Planctomycetales bacterium]
MAVDFGTEDAANGIPFGEFTWSDAGRVYSQNTSYRERLKVTLTQGQTVNFRCRMHTGSYAWSSEYQGTLTTDNTGQYPYYVRFTINGYEFKSEWTRGNCCTSWGDDWVQLNPIPNTTGVFYTISRWQSRNAYTTIAVVPTTTGTRTSSPDCGDMSTPEPGVYYVRASGSDSNDGRTMNRAFRTVNKAAASVIPGDTVYVGAGTYAENVTFSKGGSADRRVHFIADSTGQNTGDAGEVHLNGNLTMNALQNFTLHGFKLTGAGDFLKWNGGSGNIMSRCDVSGGDNLVSIKNNAALLITGCRIHHGTDDGIDISNSSYVVVEGTIIEDNGDDGFDVDLAARALLVGCTIQNNAKDGLDLTTNSAAITRVVAERCQIIGNRDNGVRLNNSQILIRNCLIAGNRASGVRHAPTGVTHCKSSLFLCTVVGNGESGILNEAGSTYVRNSIVAMNRDFGINQRSVSGEIAHSLLYGNRVATYGNITRIGGSNSNPAFVSDTDFRLSEGSPAIDAGIAPWQADFDLTGFTLSALSHDLLGNARPSGTALDMGCYEGEVTVDRVLYVATNGNDANTGTSWGQAYRTLEKACSLAGPNTQIHIRAGTYPETFILARSGRADRPIRFIAETPGAVFIQPKSSTMATTLTLSNANHVHFDGLTFTDGN